MDPNTPTPDQLREVYRAIQLDPLDEGYWFEEIMHAWGLSEAQLALHLDKPRAYIQQRRLLLRASPAVQVGVHNKLISFSQARGICLGAPRDREAQRRAFQLIHRRLEAGERLTERQCRTLALEIGRAGSRGPGRV
jgi:ParB-like chromosome segregation protein Spo0J